MCGPSLFWIRYLHSHLQIQTSNVQWMPDIYFCHRFFLEVPISGTKEGYKDPLGTWITRVNSSSEHQSHLLPPRQCFHYLCCWVISYIYDTASCHGFKNMMDF